MPVLVLAAGVETPEIAAIRADSGYIARHLPKTTTIYREVPDASHFSFMQLCKPDGEKSSKRCHRVKVSSAGMAGAGAALRSTRKSQR